MDCFCGCGRKVRFVHRAANAYGETSLLLVQRLTELSGRQDPAYRLLLDRGREWTGAYASVTHGEGVLGSLSVEGWRTWCDMAERTVEEADAGTLRD
jgi:hypothetical protein